MNKQPWYKTMFENYAEHYDQERFTQGTMGECDFIEQEIGPNKKSKILDVGCGTGRHAIELTRRGYHITGIDLSENMLKRAREKAEQLELYIDFQQHNARHLPFEDEFDVAIMLCEGGFPLMETDEENFEILQSVSRALKPKGKLIFTTLNGLFPLFNDVEKFTNETSNEGNATYHKHSFDLMTMRDIQTIEFKDDQGQKRQVKSNERYYIPSEITWLLKSLGYTTIDIFGAKLGAFSRKDLLTPNDFEMLVIGELGG